MNDWLIRYYHLDEPPPSGPFWLRWIRNLFVLLTPVFIVIGCVIVTGFFSLIVVPAALVAQGVWLFTGGNPNLNLTVTDFLLGMIVVVLLGIVIDLEETIHTLKQKKTKDE